MGRQLYNVAKREAAKTIQDGGDPIVAKIVETSINEAPIRSFGEVLSATQVEGVLLLLNGRYFKGILKLIRSGSAKK